jgi:catechol 2,3-dioxygenase-like lactoylglutathione lyase family enzyme
MTRARVAVSHVVLFCYDFQRMLEFYTKVLGFQLSDIGRARGNDICFLTLDPETDHHQIALASGRQGPKEAGALNHVAFRVGSLAELKRRRERLEAAGVDGLDPITHGSWLSVYFRDLEGNRLEFFCDTPYYVRQPIVEPLDIPLDVPEADAWRAIEAKYGRDPSFKPMADWKAEAVKRKSDATT